MKPLDIEEQKALHYLARRRNKDMVFAFEYQWVTWLSRSSFELDPICLICNKQFEEVLVEHGLMHLKDSNLLPFI